MEIMKMGEVSLITIGPEYGFGNIETQRDLAVIPPNSTLIYEVEMVSFTKEKESSDMDTPEKIESSKQNKEQGLICLRLESTTKLQRNMIKMKNILIMTIPLVPRRKRNQRDWGCIRHDFQYRPSN